MLLEGGTSYAVPRDTSARRGLQEVEQPLTNPLQRLLALQMRQMQFLTKQQAENKVDPLHAAPSGGG